MENALYWLRHAQETLALLQRQLAGVAQELGEDKPDPLMLEVERRIQAFFAARETPHADD